MKILWTDGSANPNPGPGGYAVIEDGKPVRLGRDNPTTNIKMEGTAILEAMKYADGEKCEIHTDSEFWINVLTKWAPVWQGNDWKKSSRGGIKNLDLVKKVYGLYIQVKPELIWERGHAGVEMNELADEWANKAREGAEV